DAVRANLARGEQLLERTDRLLERHAPAPVEQMDVEPVRAEPLERSLAGRERAAVRRVLRQHLRDEEHLVAAARDRAADEPLDSSAAVELGRIDVRHAEIDPDAQRLDRLALVVALHVPRALSEQRHLDAGRAE